MHLLPKWKDLILYLLKDTPAGWIVMRCRAGLSVAVATDARDEQRKRGEHTKCSKETSACSPMFDFSCKRIWKGCIYINLSVYIHAIHPGHFGFKTNVII